MLLSTAKHIECTEDFILSAYSNAATTLVVELRPGEEVFIVSRTLGASESGANLSVGRRYSPDVVTSNPDILTSSQNRSYVIEHASIYERH